MAENSSSRRAKARVEILEAHRDWQVQNGRLGWGSIGAFAAAYADGKVEVPAWVKEAYPAVDRGTIGRWWSAYDRGGAEALVPAYGNRRGAGAFDNAPDVREAIAVLLREHPRMSATGVLARLETQFPGRYLPSKRSLQRFLSSI
ncbi:MAG: helix-turn-helix domain-containing protein [Parvibaculum sp.]|uniref:helix-turn-helix domain-containing protein n=1 Tax=Parvibaculum sp. TaxID=2024848 RepID=UPI002726BD45|nr:helix-turn-helix domain-containing protein [Parvibaculum sp.]MDO8840672.1 helix-turn-helix domain-containing protein [Parvibaculum sp.]